MIQTAGPVQWLLIQPECLLNCHTGSEAARDAGGAADVAGAHHRRCGARPHEHRRLVLGGPMDHTYSAWIYTECTECDAIPGTASDRAAQGAACSASAQAHCALACQPPSSTTLLPPAQPDSTSLFRRRCARNDGWRPGRASVWPAAAGGYRVPHNAVSWAL